MTPIEIEQLKRMLPSLRRAFQTHKAPLWQFLRQEVASDYAIIPCVQCRQKSPLLETPYKPDLCIDCLLRELLEGGPIEDRYRDPRSRDYDPDYDRGWDPPDGPEDSPPIAWS